MQGSDSYHVAMSPVNSLKVQPGAASSAVEPKNPTNALLVGFWIWHFDTAKTSCGGAGGEQLSGYFTTNLTSTLPLTITPGGPKATTGQFIARLVQ